MVKNEVSETANSEQSGDAKPQAYDNGGWATEDTTALRAFTLARNMRRRLGYLGNEAT